MRANQRPLNAAWLVTGLALLMLAGMSWVTRPAAWAEAGVRRTAPVEHFKSGAQRSEQLLTKILATLERMDQRMARIEQAVQQVAQDSGRTGFQQAGRKP